MIRGAILATAHLATAQEVTGSWVGTPVSAASGAHFEPPIPRPSIRPIGKSRRAAVPSFLTCTAERF